jgi:hypothetical protein
VRQRCMFGCATHFAWVRAPGGGGELEALTRPAVHADDAVPAPPVTRRTTRSHASDHAQKMGARRRCEKERILQRVAGLRLYLKSATNPRSAALSTREGCAITVQDRVPITWLFTWRGSQRRSCTAYSSRYHFQSVIQEQLQAERFAEVAALRHIMLHAHN